MPDLSILIPARNEEWLARTVADVIAHTGNDTEIIVVLDGAPADPEMTPHPRLKVFELDASIGQRAATNLAAQHADSPFLMKLDAHCAVAPGFDAAMIGAAVELGDAVTLVPSQKNLHIFDWVCEHGHRWYMGPTPEKCFLSECDAKSFTRDIQWKPRRGSTTNIWRFDSELHFQYWKQPGPAERYPATLSCLGACWMLSRDRFFALGALDEGHGSWGQMGTEIACKSWLSGGELRTVTATWFAHLFRTRPGFSFPYPISKSQTEQARRYSRDLWRGNHWPGQTRTLRSLLEQFWPVPGWTEEDLAALPTSLERAA